MIVIYIYIVIKILYYVWRVISYYNRAKLNKLNDFVFKLETVNGTIKVYLDKETNKIKYEYANSNI